MHSPVAAARLPRFAIRAGRVARSRIVSATGGDAVTVPYDSTGSLYREHIVSGSLRGFGGRLAVEFVGSGVYHSLADSRPTDRRETDEHEVIVRRVETGRMIVSINNGNITEYVDTSGTVVAHYRYDPLTRPPPPADSGSAHRCAKSVSHPAPGARLGRTLYQTGTLVGNFEFRFSTKRIDPETGCYYYGYRYYNPSIARWLNRDPIGEDGGLNLYGFVGNDGVNMVDSLGLSPGPWSGVRPGGTPCADCHPPKFREVDNLYSIFGDPPPPPEYPLPSIGKWPVPYNGTSCNIFIISREVLDNYCKFGNHATVEGVDDESCRVAHCIASCRVAKCYGGLCAEGLGIAKEYLDAIKGIWSGPGFDWGDIVANGYGHEIAASDGDCEDDCMRIPAHVLSRPSGR